MNRPSNDELRTWHTHDDGTWEWEAVCLTCMANAHQAGDMPNFNIERLKADNKGGYTQRMIRDEIYEAAREDGRDITRA